MNQTGYTSRKYNHPVRWMNFWHQIDEVARLNPDSILEVGKGSGLVSDHLKKMGYRVTTVDVDQNTNPDIIASVENLPIGDKQYDAVIAAEILEHLPFENVTHALAELHRVAKQFVVITLPYAGGRFLFRLKIPFIPEMRIFVPLPFFWKRHIGVSPSGHHWEVGARGWPRRRIRNVFLVAGFSVEKEKIFHDDFNHIIFVLKK